MIIKACGLGCGKIPFLKRISLSDHAKWDVFINKVEEGVRKHSDESHTQFWFGSLPCSTSGKDREIYKTYKGQ